MGPRPPVEVLVKPAGRAACVQRDVAGVFRLLTAAGHSQRAIGRMTGQAQSEVSEIINGRQVVSVVLLERIADGLGCPRAWWRLNGENEHGDLQRLSGAIALSRITVARREAEREQYLAAVEELQQTAAVLLAQARDLEALLSARNEDIDER